MGCREIVKIVMGGVLLCSSVACAANRAVPTPLSSPFAVTTRVAPNAAAKGGTSPTTDTVQNAPILNDPSASEKGETANAKTSPTPAALSDDQATKQVSPSSPEATPPSPHTATAAQANDLDLTDDQADDTEDEDVITYDVPVVRNESVTGYIEYFQVTIRERFEKWLSRSSRYLPTMTKIFRDQGLPEDLVFVALIESGFNPYAYSRAKASGTWQFIRSTGKRYGLTINDWVDERRDPIKSTVAAASYLKDLYAMFGSWPLALASYNAGEGKIQKAIRRTKSDDFWDIKNTRYIRRETKDYVPKFMAATIIAKDPERYGFALMLTDPLRFEEVTVDRPIALESVATAIGIDPQEMKELNPELKRGVTPPYARGYVLRVPMGTREMFLANQDRVPTFKGPYYTKHRIRRGETLQTIARRYRTTVETLKTENHLRSSRVRVGKILKVPTTGVAGETDRARKPAGASKVSSSSSTNNETRRTVYRVRSGDTLSSIAKDFNVRLTDILKWNDTRKQDMIRPGDRIVLYTDTEDS